MVYDPGLSFRFGYKLTIVLILSCIVGFVWAMVERRPWEKLEQTSTISREKPEPKRLPELPEKNPTPVTPEPEPALPEEPGIEPEPKPTREPSLVVEKQLQRLFRTAQKMISQAEYDKAAEELQKVNEIQIEVKARRTTLRGWKTRVEIYRALVKETEVGRIIPMPEITRIDLKNGGKVIARKVTSEETYLSVVDIQGIRSRIEKKEIARLNKLEPHTAFWEIWEKLQSKCRSWQIEAKEEKVGSQFVFSFQEKKGGSVSGEKFFRLADFCISNGANRLVTTLLDEALSRERNLLKIVHEKKGDKLVTLLFYFLSVPSPSSAEHLLQSVLRPRYSDTSAYQQRVQKDPELIDLLSKLLDKPIETAPDQPQEEEALQPAPQPTEKDLPKNTPKSIQELILQGDQYYKKGIEHLLKSDPSKNPGSWAKENNLALELFRKAAGSYATAQESYPENGSIPQSLLDRFRETQIRMSLCRKRGVSNR